MDHLRQMEFEPSVGVVHLRTKRVFAIGKVSLHGRETSRRKGNKAPNQRLRRFRDEISSEAGMPSLSILLYNCISGMRLTPQAS